MGYRGKTVEQERARELRADGWTYAEICTELGVSRSSVSLWVRDIPIDEEEVWAKRVRKNKRFGAQRRRNTFELRKLAEIERIHTEARERLGRLSEREFLVTGIARYAGEGAKTDGAVKFANSDPRMIVVFLAWLRRFFPVDESRLRFASTFMMGSTSTPATGSGPS